MKTSVLSVLFALLLPGVSLADPLPADAKPMGSEGIAKLYAGNSAIWSRSRAVFLADGSVKGLFKGDNGAGIFWGKWVVRKNEICMTVQGINTTSGEEFSGSKDCWKWWLDGEGKPITLWSVHFDGSAVDLEDGYYRDEISKLKKGDKVSSSFDKAYAKAKG